MSGRLRSTRTFARCRGRQVQPRAPRLIALGALVGEESDLPHDLMVQCRGVRQSTSMRLPAGSRRCISAEPSMDRISADGSTAAAWLRRSGTSMLDTY
jgi:hypothetical protein